MSQKKFIDNFKQSNIAYVKQIDFNTISTVHNVKHNNDLPISNKPHPAIILKIYEDDNLILILCGQSITKKKLEEFQYTHVTNDYIVLKSQHTGLKEDTLFQMHARNINLIDCNTNHFQKKGGVYVLGNLDDAEKSLFNKKLNQHKQILNIINYLENEGCQILPKEEQKNELYKLPLTKRKKKKQ